MQINILYTCKMHPFKIHFDCDGYADQAIASKCLPSASQPLHGLLGYFYVPSLPQHKSGQPKMFDLTIRGSQEIGLERVTFTQKVMHITSDALGV